MFTNTLLNEEVTKIKVVDLDELYNFGIYCLKVSKSYLKLPFIEIQILNYTNFVKWKDGQNKNCR